MEHTQKQTKPAKKQFHNVKGNGDKNGTHPKMDKISKKYTNNVSKRKKMLKNWQKMPENTKQAISKRSKKSIPG